MRRLHHFLAGIPFALLAACGSGGTDPDPPVQAACDNPATINLAVGVHQVVNPRDSDGCIRLPAAAGGASYLIAGVSGAGNETPTGTSGSYWFQVTPSGAQGSPPAVPSLAAERGDIPLPVRFHRMLREQEREFAARPDLQVEETALLAPAAAPEVGSERQFSVCRNTACSQFDTVTAVARAVGSKVAVYYDKAAPANGLTQEDLDGLELTFNDYHYPIAAQAFGTESDLDNNGVVILLITPAVNRLTTNCSGGRIIGFFWPGDMLNIAGSNRGEILYGLSTSAASGSCSEVTRERALAFLKPVMIHELQHMVNYNQKVRVAGAQSSEEVWLNEGLSHYAEELAGRLIPNADCPPPSTSCLLFYNTGNLLNLYDYLEDTEGSYMVVPRNSTGTLAERGAVWSFVRWLADHHGSDSLGMDLTAKLVRTARMGRANVEAATGQQFPRLVGEWFLALYLDDLPGFGPGSPRLTFPRWNFRAIFANNCCTMNAPFPNAYPFAPTPVIGPFSRSGVLRDGSGRHFQVTMAPGSPAFDVLLARQSGGLTIDESLAARFAIVRLQ